MNKAALKIGFVLDDTLDTPDGVQQYVLTLGAWLAMQGHDVHYLVGKTERSDVPNVHSLSRNVKVNFNGNRMSMPLPVSRRRLAGMLARESYDVLHVQMPYSPWLAHRVILAAPPDTAIVGTFHVAPHSGIVRYATKALGIWTRRSMKRFDKIVSVSQPAADFAAQTYGVTTDVLPNVVDATRFATAEAFSRYADKPTVVFLGRLVPRKGCQYLLEAARRLRVDSPELDFRVVVCGRGPLEAPLKAYAAANDLSEIVEFTGFVTEDDKPRYLKSADLAVFPSTGGESFGIVLIEAMAAGRPVVLGADNPGYGTVLAPYPDTLFPVADVSSLTNKLKLFLTDADARARATAWQAGYVSQFDVAVVGAKLTDIYNDAHAGAGHQ